MAPPKELLQRLGGGRQKSSRGIPRKARSASRKARRAKYYAQVYQERKLRHLLQHTGLNQARSWAATHQADGVLNYLLRTPLGLKAEQWWTPV